MSAASKAVFLSYASQDADAARKIAEALLGAQIEVWFDQSELRGGDAWDQKIRRQIKECALFVPVISANTQARLEGYFRLEWKLAEDRSHLMARGKPFIVPVCVDETKDWDAIVPDSFMSVQWTRLPAGVTTPQFVEQVERLLGNRSSSAVGIRPESEAHKVAPQGQTRAMSKRMPRWTWAAMAVGGVAIGVSGFLASRKAETARATPSPPPVSATPASAAVPAMASDKSIAVLPFANLSGDKEQEYFSDGLTEEILNALARERDLRVPGRASAFAFKGKNIPISDIAKALGVTQLVEGSVSRASNRVRIRVQLTRASDGFSEALGTFDRELNNIFALQDEVARAVVEKITRRTARAPVIAQTKNAEAYDFYLRGRALQTHSGLAATAAAQLYERAVALDPTFALAWARLAEARFSEYSFFDRSSSVMAATRAAITRALEIDPNRAEALIARANWLREAAYDYAAARRDLDRAESLQPPTAELRYAQALLARDSDQLAEAARLAREALALDPQNGWLPNTIAVAIFSLQRDMMEVDRLYARSVAIQAPDGGTPFRNRV